MLTLIVLSNPGKRPRPFKSQQLTPGQAEPPVPVGRQSGASAGGH